jgi:hypothetical protein
METNFYAFPDDVYMFSNMNSREVYLCKCYSATDGTNNCMLLPRALIWSAGSCTLLFRPQCWLGWIRKVGNYGLPYTGKGAAPRSCRADLTVPLSQSRGIVAANCLCTWESIWLPPGTSHNWKLQVNLVVSRALGRSRLSAAVCIVVVHHRRIKPCSAAAILIF